ncbi:MAG: spinster family MFS transporter [Deltaproteobacteria bacterium]
MQDDRVGNRAEHEEYPAAGYAWYVVAVLTLAYVVSFIDRQILGLLVKPIQEDLGIGDKQISLLMGATFAVFYTLFGIPLGRLADTCSRRTIIAAGIGFWSLMTAGCGLAKSFWQLAVLRVGVGVGEAALSPSAYSLIADYFRPERRSTAMSVYSMGIFVGSGLAFILGGLVVRFSEAQKSFLMPLIGMVRSWQLVFLIVGLPGLAMALLLYTIREPTRKGIRRLTEGTDTAPRATMREVWAYLLDNWGTFACLNLGVAMITLNTYGMSSWVPSMFIRRYGWSPAETGMVFGLIVGTSGTLGIVTGGRVADWLSERGYGDATVRVAGFAALAWLPFGVVYPLVPSAAWSAAIVTPAMFFSSMPFGVAPAAIQRMMPNTMRAQATAVYLFVINLIGMGLGPTLVAALTEDVFRDKQAVHYSLAIVGAISQTMAGVLLCAGLKRYRRSLEYFEEWDQAREEGSKIEDAR